MNQLNFKGSVGNKVELPERADLGDVMCTMDDRSVYVYISSWELIDCPNSEEPYRATGASAPIKPKAQICTQCSGGLEFDKFGRLVCPYCGTLYKF